MLIRCSTTEQLSNEVKEVYRILLVSLPSARKLLSTSLAFNQKCLYFVISLLAAPTLDAMGKARIAIISGKKL